MHSRYDIFASTQMSHKCRTIGVVSVLFTPFAAGSVEIEILSFDPTLTNTILRMIIKDVNCSGTVEDLPVEVVILIMMA